MRRILVGLFTVGLAIGTASAQLLVDPSSKVDTGKIEVGAMMNVGKTEYEADGGGSGDIKRTIIGAYGAYGINDMIDAYGGIGLIAKAKPEDSDESGSGFVFGGGVRAAVFSQDKLTVMVYGELHYISEDYGEYSESGTIPYRGPWSITHTIKGSGMELAGGALAKYAVTPEVTVYGGLELVPFSSLEIEDDVEVTGLDPDDYDAGGSTDVSRDSMFGIRFGATYQMQAILLRAELAMVSEQTFTIGAGYRF